MENVFLSSVSSETLSKMEVLQFTEEESNFLIWLFNRNQENEEAFVVSNLNTLCELYLISIKYWI